MPELQRGERISYCIRVLKGSVQSVSVVRDVNDRSTGLLLIINHRFPWIRRLQSALRSWQPGSLLPVHAGVYWIGVETDQSTLGTMENVLDILHGQMMLVMGVEPVHHVCAAHTNGVNGGRHILYSKSVWSISIDFSVQVFQHRWQIRESRHLFR
jgi:hypothetical protein